MGQTCSCTVLYLLELQGHSDVVAWKVDRIVAVMYRRLKYSEVSDVDDVNGSPRSRSEQRLLSTMALIVVYILFIVLYLPFH